MLVYLHFPDIPIFWDPSFYTVCEEQSSSVELTLRRTLYADGEETDAPQQTVTITTRDGTV